MVRTLGKMGRCARGTAGFTLIEVIMVMMILVLVTTLAVISLTGANKSSNVAACKTEYRSVRAALAAYLNDLGDSASPATALDVYSDSGLLVSGGYLAKLSDSGRYRIVFSTSDPKTAQVQVQINGSNYSEDGCDNISSG